MLRLIISLTLLSLSLANIVKRSEYTLFKSNTIHSLLHRMEIMGILYVWPLLNCISLNKVLRILGSQETIIVTASKILSDFIYKQCISFSALVNFTFVKL